MRQTLPSSICAAIRPIRARPILAGLGLACLATVACAQTRSQPAPVPSPQTPTRSVAAKVPLSRAQAAAAKIDQLLAQDLRRQQLEPTDLVDDATFLRRVYLQAVGHIPNLQEVEEFLADTTADKRARLVDRLLDSPGYTSNESNFWFDLLRVKSRQRQLSGEPFAHWIRESVREGMPYDAFVREMLTATGPAQQEGNGATGYLLRDANMPHDAMANTLRLFLGTRVECAQCHNHPFDKWTQREFYGMAAFFGGLRYRVDLDRQVAVALRDQLADADDRTKAGARRILRSMVTGLAGGGSGQERLPADYRYDDAKPRSVVQADTIFGADVKVPRAKAATARPRARDARQPPGQRPEPQPDVGSRQLFADWLTDARNPRFARTITNRLWQRTFGRGLIEPVDDLKDDSVSVHPQLSNYLEKLLVDLDFDLRQFERVLLLTKLFQQQSLGDDAPLDQPYRFRAPLLRRLTAEQFWDSLLTLVYADIDQRMRPTDERARAVYQRQAELSSGSPTEVAALLVRYGDPQQERARRIAMVTERRAAQTEQQGQMRQLRRDLVLARRRGDTAAQQRLSAELEELVERGREGQLLRASDLEQPAPAGHPLRQFGQSDRETVDGATLAASVPQALTLLNGTRSSGTSSLHRQLDQAPSDAGKVRAAFLMMLAREPDAAESELWCGELARDRAAGQQDLVWTLCNSNEFRFRQ